MLHHLLSVSTYSNKVLAIVFVNEVVDFFILDVSLITTAIIERKTMETFLEEEVLKIIILLAFAAIIIRVWHLAGRFRGPDTGCSFP